MENHVLSIERMQHLRELGLNTSKASMCWRRTTRDWKGEEVKGRWSLTFNKPFISSNFELYEIVPTFTLQDILESLPHKIKSYFLFLLKDKYALREGICYNIYYRSVRERKTLIEIRRDSLLDAAYEMLCWCIENGHIKSK